MALNDYEFQIGALVLGGAGSDYIVQGWDGMGIPALRNSDSEKPQDYGTFLGPDLISERTLRLDLTVRGDTPADVVSKVDALLVEWYVDSRTDTDVIKPLSLKLPGQAARRLNGRPRRTNFDPRRIIGNRVDGTLEYHGADPRWYSDEEHSEGLVLVSATTGRSYDKGFDYGYGGSGTSGTETLSNAGSIGTLPTVRFTGPVTNPYIENVTTDKTFQLTYTLGSGEFIDVNFAEATVMLGGTASRYYAKSGDFWELVPGDNSVRFGASAYDAAASATVTWRDAWL